MIHKNRLDAATGFAMMFGAAVVALMFMSCQAKAAGVRRVCQTCNVQRAVNHYPIAVAQAYAAPLYQVGQHMQRQAVDTNAFRHSQEYLEYLQLKGFQAGVAATQQQVQPQAPPQPQQQWQQPASQPQQESVEVINPATGSNWTAEELRANMEEAERQQNWQATPPAPQPENAVPQTPETQQQTDVEWFKQRYPTIAATCMGCHGGKDPENPDGGLALNGTVQIIGNNRYVDSTGREIALPLLILEKTYNNHMPPNKGVNDQTYSAIQTELLLEEVAPDGI